MVLSLLLYKCFLWAFVISLGEFARDILVPSLKQREANMCFWNETRDPGSPAGTEGRALINVTYRPYHFCVLRSISLG